MCQAYTGVPGIHRLPLVTRKDGAVSINETNGSKLHLADSNVAHWIPFGIEFR